MLWLTGEELPDAALAVVQDRRRRRPGYLERRPNALQFFQDIFHAADEDRAFAQELMDAGAGRTIQQTRHGKHLPALLGGVTGGDERAAALGGLDDHHAARKAADQP